MLPNIRLEFDLLFTASYLVSKLQYSIGTSEENNMPLDSAQRADHGWEINTRGQ